MYLRFLAAASVVAFTAAASAQTAPVRPEITGISHIAVFAADPAATDHYYREVIGADREPDPENPRGMRYAINNSQFIEVLPLPPGVGINRLDHTAYNTDNAEGMRRYLAAHSWKTPAKVEDGADGSHWFTVLDPEGNKVEFVQPPPGPKAIDAPNVIGRHIIHFGFLVHNRAVEDTFYRLWSEQMPLKLNVNNVPPRWTCRRIRPSCGCCATY
jgi:catechol 2,3-dioxygenase-like lactoylglutathione lyase family enzyme